ncbi:helix-turn-helix domain-containing protein [Desulfogranum mediterraneum]|uniref:helix-turn-helix domain-containing protein n=1 Tax=Desulfogranum mediterraneum TaxID=160661 RepID=UPI0004191428|nr:helix-turn-helix domain-containing protein [Desulfogranum mediterraneum]
MRINENSPPAAEEESVGSQLRNLRQARGISLQEVSAATKVSLSNLTALEELDYEQLPADTFIRGQLSFYAEFLGLDAPQVVERFFAERNRHHRPGRSAKKIFSGYSQAPKKFAEPAHIPSVTAAALLFAVIIISLTGFCIYTSWNPFAYFTDKTISLSSQVMEAFSQAGQPRIHRVEADRLLLQARFNGDIEVEITVDGEESRRRVFQRDQQAQWQASERLLLNLSPPVNAALTLNGRPLNYPEDLRDGLLLQLNKAQPPE